MRCSVEVGSLGAEAVLELQEPLVRRQRAEGYPASAVFQLGTSVH